MEIENNLYLNLQTLLNLTRRELEIYIIFSFWTFRFA